MINIKITGLKEEEARIREARLALARGEVFAKAWRVYVMTAVPVARSLCHVDTGDVRASIRSRLEGNRGILEATSPDAKFHHDGTTKQKPNPFLDITVKQTNPLLERLIETELRKALK